MVREVTVLGVGQVRLVVRKRPHACGVVGAGQALGGQHFESGEGPSEPIEADCGVIVL